MTVKTTIIKNGKITDEIFDNYQPAFGKYPIDGVFKYKYGTADFPEERLYYNSKEDTLKVKYFFTKNNIRKQETWESERRSKLRKGAPEYGDGKPGGCIPAEEDLIRYRKWVKRGIFIYESSDNRLNTIKVCYDYSGNYPESIVFTYKDDLLINKKALGMRGKRINWEENYEYKDGKVIMTKKNYITYWGKIPPTEKWTYEFDSNKREIKVTKELEGQLDKEILSKEYYNNGNLKRLTKTINGTETTIDYLVTYR
ncbi:hypothetical protein [Ohtaekwangia sp.]|uniref:hypothetical protein n=1 Tax=Ohtaekwangia sp. TaxID=2066019 RepID=UPI002FDD2C5D